MYVNVVTVIMSSSNTVTATAEPRARPTPWSWRVEEQRGGEDDGWRESTVSLTLSDSVVEPITVGIRHKSS